jgi:hypothetical protein
MSDYEKAKEMINSSDPGLLEVPVCIKAMGPYDLLHGAYGTGRPGYVCRKCGDMFSSPSVTFVSGMDSRCDEDLLQALLPVIKKASDG